jgi:predicted ATPase
MIHATGVDLPQVLRYHYNNDREKFDSFEAMAQRVLPEIDIIETPLVPGSNNVTVRIRFRAGPVMFELASLSSGIKDVLVLLAAAHFSPPGSLVLIEEAETHLHAAAQKALCSVIRELARTEQKQFVLTTHSEFILGQFDAAQSVLIERCDSGSKAIPLEKVDVYSLWQRLGIERSKLLEVLGRTRQVVVVTESRNDAKILEVLAKDDHELSDCSPRVQKVVDRPK